MKTHQRYISRELTHFVGRGKTEDEQYAILLTILKSGQLRHPRHDTEEDGFRWYTDGRRISDNNIYEPCVVCFCDIPLGDLQIHIAKYSRFGVSFTKEFLLSKGASPVFYVATDALAHQLGLVGRGPVTLGSLFDQAVSMLTHSIDRLLKFPTQWPTESPDVQEIAEADRMMVFAKDGPMRDEAYIRHFLMVHVLSYIKFFEAKSLDEDPDNFFMEREWRILGSVKFAVSDVERLILPREYGNKIRQDLPEFGGQLTYV